MKFLIDAQLPRSLARWLEGNGYDAIHTLALPQGNRTPDAEIARLADAEERVVVTKDGDFVHGHLLSSQPRRLLLIATGNVSNKQLEKIIADSLNNLIELFLDHNFLELGDQGLVVRD